MVANRKQTVQIRQSQNPSTDLIIENDIKQSNLRQIFFDFHRRYWAKDNIKEQSHDLFLFRIVNILGWLFVVIIDFLAYSNVIKSYSTILNSFFGASYLLKNIIAIGYASGAAAYGASIEVYYLVPFVILNCILAIKNCSIVHGVTRESIAAMFITLALIIGTELAHQNYKCFTYQQSYKLHYRTATRAMLRPSIYLCVTILFLTSSGLRAVYNAARFKCSYVYQINNQSNCNLIDIDQPLFNDTDSCVPDFIAMITSLEQLRIIRDIALCSIAFYSMYNKAFLDITGIVNIIHRIVLFLFFTMSCSIVFVSVDPFQFNQFKVYFDLMEGSIFVILLILLLFNLRKKYKHRDQIIMEINPTIFG